MNFNIKEYKTIESLEAFRKEMNEACDKRASFIRLCNRCSELSEMPFGYIKESFEALSPSLFKSANGRLIIKHYTDAIKKNRTLSTMHNLYENVRKTNKNSDIEFFIKALSSTDWGVNASELAEGVKTIGSLLGEAYATLGADIAEPLLPVVNNSVHTAIEFIAENKMTAKNIAKYGAAVKVLRESIEENEDIANIFESTNLDAIANELLREYNEKYTDTLSEEEKAVIREVAESNNPEEVFNKYKEACKTKVLEAKNNYEANGDTSSANKLMSIYEQVSKKTYVPDSISEDLCNLIEISNIFGA